MFSLEGRRILVTGGGAGIGKAIAVALCGAGGRVAVADIDGAAAEATAAAIRADGGDATSLAADVGDLGDIDRMVAETVAALGAIDVLVNNAGVTRHAGIMDLTEEDWDRIHRINAKGVFFCLQRAAREMIPAGGGVIINIASIAGRGFAHTSNAIYAASKGAVISLTKTASQQLGPHNINVNAICPGITRTALLERIFLRRAEERGMTPAEAEALAARDVPIRRINEPEDIAAMAVFLASPAARNITGQSYNVDGGIIPS